MRLVVVCGVGVIGGAERVLLAGLDSVPEFSRTLIALAEGPLVSAARDLGARVVVVPMPQVLARQGDSDQNRVATLAGTSGKILAFLRRLGHELRQARPTLVHVHGIKAQLLVATVLPAGVPVVWHWHDFLRLRGQAGRLLWLLSGRVRGVVAISQAAAEDARLTLPKTPVRVVANCVDLRTFSPEGPTADLDALAGLPEGKYLRVGLVATYATWKGHDVFLAAMKLLAELPIRGYIVGGPIYTTANQWSQAELRRQAPANVGFVPFQPDPASVYRALDIVVHASTKPEPFGLVIAEGMACGRAVIVSQAGGAIELFTQNYDAIGVQPGEPPRLADAIRRLAEDAEFRQQLGENARRSAMERFSQERYARELRAVYEELRK